MDKTILNNIETAINLCNQVNSCGDCKYARECNLAFHHYTPLEHLDNFAYFVRLVTTK